MKKRPAKKDAPRLVSIPDDVVLSPQSEVPRQLTGSDRSARRAENRVRELSWADFDRLVAQLARDIQRRFKPDAVVGVAHGGVFVGGAIASALAADFYPVRISRRSRDKQVRKSPRMFGEMPRDLKGKKVLICDDVAASGDTLELAKELAAKVKAKDVETACLVQREGGYSPSFCALETDALLVFPWDYEPVAEDGRFDVDPEKAGA